MVQSDDIADAGAQGYQGGVDLSDEPAGNWLHMDTDDFHEVFPSDVFPNEKMIVLRKKTRFRFSKKTQKMYQRV